MPIPKDSLVPEDVTGELEALAQGDGPFSGPLEDAEQKRLEQAETGLADEIDPLEADRLKQEQLQTQERLQALEQRLDPVLVDEPRLLPDDAGFWAKITGNAADGTNRWKYSFEEVYKSATGYGVSNWTAVTDGRTGTEEARNTIENMNDAAGIQGNGVTVANLDTAAYTFVIMACTTNNVVWMRSVTVTDTDNTIEYWFSYVNGVDGTCD